MQIEIKRDGLTLRGDLIKPDIEKCPVAIFFHGFLSARDNDLLSDIADACVKNGIAAVRFDFNGHGESDGDLSDMNPYSELLDAAKIMDYVRSLDFVTEIYIAGHSMGGVIGGMTAGLYRDAVKKLLLLAPAVSMKKDAQLGNYFGSTYNSYKIPDFFPVQSEKRGIKGNLNGFFFRAARTLPVYEVTSEFKGETFIIHGTADEAVSFEGSSEFKKYMPDAKIWLIEGENHGMNAVAREEIVKRAAAFFKGDKA